MHEKNRLSVDLLTGFQKKEEELAAKWGLTDPNCPAHKYLRAMDELASITTCSRRSDLTAGVKLYKILLRETLAVGAPEPMVREFHGLIMENMATGRKLGIYEAPFNVDFDKVISEMPQSQS